MLWDGKEHGQRHIPVSQAAQSCIQPGFERFQGWTCTHNFIFAVSLWVIFPPQPATGVAEMAAVASLCQWVARETQAMFYARLFCTPWALRVIDSLTWFINQLLHRRLGKNWLWTALNVRSGCNRTGSSVWSVQQRLHVGFWSFSLENQILWVPLVLQKNELKWFVKPHGSVVTTLGSHQP